MAIRKMVDGLVAKGDTAFKPSLEHAVKVCGATLFDPQYEFI
jgi:hypothetical protein